MNIFYFYRHNLANPRTHFVAKFEHGIVFQICGYLKEFLDVPNTYQYFATNQAAILV